MSQALDPFTLPLRGSSLIEASAGTGKTYTIALLYTRLVLQHDGHSAFPRALTPEDILVVTFTDAATQELRDRIRARLSDAARCFMDDSTNSNHDPALIDLRNSYAECDWSRCAQTLTLAAQSMDQAAVSTIHGWCFRMLREHAFDSGTLFRQQLITQMRDVLAELVRDYWRQHFYTLDAASTALVQRAFNGPDDLLDAVRGLLNKVQTTVTFRNQPMPVADDLQSALAPVVARDVQCQEELQRARELWVNHWHELSRLLDELQPGMHKGTYTEAKDDEDFAALKNALLEWAEHGSEVRNLKRFGSDGMRLNKGYEAPEHPALLAIDAYFAAEEDARAEHRVPANAIVLQHARQWLEQALEQRIHTRAEMGYDDLLLQLDRALHGPQGDQLAAQIREQFPVALIDEFQDTDPLQYRIFNRIYRIADNDADHAIVLIGDPKQSIYSFRNADIHTYLAARNATSGRHFHLGTNFRSSQALVDAVNACFEHAEQFPAGAFRFRDDDGNNPLPFHAVAAHGRTETLCRQKTAVSALTIWNVVDAETPGATLSRSDYQDALATQCAARIAEILNPATNWAFCGDTSVAVRASDIAILVRNRHEAQAARSALQLRGLASVYLSDQESVFASTEAHDVLRWLIACAEPGNEGAIRAALGTASLALSFAELRQLYQDESRWEEQAELFRHLHQRWRRDGVLPMLRELLQRHQVARRLAEHTDGERILTNLLHLAEYLQQASTEHEGEQALIRHLREAMKDPGDEEVLRLESDAELIRIVTIHKSKGLQYPLVFVPFAASWRPVQANKPVTLPAAHDSLQRRLEIAGKRADEDTLLAEQERLAEDLRLLYVAMTRAVHALWLGVGLLTQGNSKSPQLHHSALGYLLGGGEALDETTLSEQLVALTVRCSDINIETVSTAITKSTIEDSIPLTALHTSVSLKPARQATHTPPAPWWISSYSALRHHNQTHEPERSADDQALEELALENPTLNADSNTVTQLMPRDFSRQDAGLHGFPRGPAQGTFLHNLLEWACAEGFNTAAEDSQKRLDAISRRCQIKGWQDDVARLDTWLPQFLQQTFKLPNDVTLKLTDLTSLQPELEFLFPAHRVNTAQIDRLCRQYLLPGQARPSLQPVTLNGMLKGFIDLTFEHQGQYYVADWKSNHLGRTDAAYSSTAIEQEVLQHRYDVQYTLYLLALHRLLRSRLPDYDYEHHIGGAVYFFLRGWQSDTQGLLFDKPPQSFIETLDALFAGQTTHQAEDHYV